jgi:PTH1 family peptidyl-tRNA hydrolase
MKYLIAGLGNPGEKYSHTRHNIGFKVLDELSKRGESTFQQARLGDVCTVKHKGRMLILLKPNTFMNLSGKAVQYYLQNEKLNLENVLVITDDLSLPFGALRLKQKGSDGGHNGLKSIQECLNTVEYPRLRFGIGNDFAKGRQVDYVLGEWTEEQYHTLPDRISLAADAVEAFCSIGYQMAANMYNNR